MSRSLGVPAATALVVGNMLGVGVLLTPRLVAGALPELGPFLGLWLLGGLVAAAGAAVYAELGSRYPEAGGDVVFQEAGLGRSVALASGVLMFFAAFCASIAAIAVAMGTWQVPTLLGQPAPDQSWVARAVGIGIIGLLTAANLRGLRLGAAVQLVTTGLPLVGLVGLALVALASGVGEPLAVAAGAPTPSASAFVEAASGVYFAYAGWPAVVYLAGEVREPARVLPRAMLGGTVLVTALYLLLNLAFFEVLGPGGLRETFEAGSALVTAVLGEGAGWLMAALVLMALLASVNATILGGARVALALARRGGLPAAFARTDARGLPRRALLLQAVVASLVVLSGTFDQILAASVLAMMAIGSLTVISLVLIRRRGAEPQPAYRATAWPLSPLVYLVPSLGMTGLGLWELVAGGGREESGAAALLLALPLLAASFRARRRSPPGGAGPRSRGAGPRSG